MVDYELECKKKLDEEGLKMIQGFIANAFGKRNYNM